MNILLNKDITGLNKDIIYNLSTKEYINTKFYNITIKDFLDLNNIKEYKNYREEYSELLNSLNIKDSHVRWTYLLDEESIKSNFENLLVRVNETKISDYESKVYPERISLSNRINKIYLCEWSWLGNKITFYWFFI